MKFVLIEVVERDISTPEFFDTYEKAFAEMKVRFSDASKSDAQVGDQLNGELNEWDAWCENRNHDNCDWKIFEFEG